MPEPHLYAYSGSLFYMHHTLTDQPDPEDFSFRSHSHDMAELYYCFGGGVEFIVEGTLYTVTPGTLIVTDRGQVHNIRITDRTVPYERAAILLRAEEVPKTMEPLLERAKNGDCRYLFAGNDRLWIEETLRLPENDPGYEEEIIPSCIRLIAARLLSMNTEGGSLPHPGDAIVRSLIDYINGHLCEEWTLDTLEKTFFRDKSYLNKRFRAVMGCGIWEYTLRKRIFSAQQVLYLTGSVTESFRGSGFSDYSNFYRNYKKVLHCSPSEDLLRMKNGSAR